MSKLPLSIRLLSGALAFSLVLVASSSVFAVGTFVNDVGNGALFWGSSNERTTYLAPYNSLRAPTISRIPEEDTNVADPLKSGVSSRTELWKTASEVGTVIGTDGKIYRYHYVQGVEPRRVVERRVVNGQVENVDRVVWETVLIRVLEPVTSGAAAADSPAPCGPNVPLPRPCEPAGESDQSMPSDNAENQDGAVNSNADPSMAPSLGSSPGREEVYDPTVGAPQEAQGSASGSSVASSSTSEEGVISVTVITRDSKYPVQSSRPIIAVPSNRRR